MSVELQGGSGRRASVRRSCQLNRLTIGWNGAEGVIAIIARVVRDRRAGRMVHHTLDVAHVRLLLHLSRERLGLAPSGAG